MKKWIPGSLLAPKKKHCKITKILKYAFTLAVNCFQSGFTIIYSSATNLAAWEVETKSIWKDASQKRDEKMLPCLYNESRLTSSAVRPPTLQRIHYYRHKMARFFVHFVYKNQHYLRKTAYTTMLFKCSSKWKKNQDALRSVVQSVAWKVLNLDIQEIMMSQHPGLHSPTNFLQRSDF